MDDSALQLGLLLFGRVVVAVLGQVPQLAGGLDLVGDLDTASGGELSKLGTQPVVRVLREVMSIGHHTNLAPAGYADTVANQPSIAIP